MDTIDCLFDCLFTLDNANSGLFLFLLLLMSRFVILYNMNIFFQHIFVLISL